MPDEQDPIELPIAGEGDAEMSAGTEAKVTVPSNLDQQNLARIASAGASAHEHFITFGKVLDYAYEAGRKMVSLVESLGVREVTSKSGQKGIPGSTD